MLHNRRLSARHPSLSNGFALPVATALMAIVLVWLVVGAAVLADESDGPKLSVPTGPDAVDDFYDHVTEDAEATLDVMANDEPDPQWGIHLFSCEQPTPYGSTRISNGKVIYTPANASETYTATFEYTVDGLADYDTATVTIAVAADNDPPDLVDHTEPAFEGTWIYMDARSMLNPDERGDVPTFAFWDPQGDPVTWWDAGGSFWHKPRSGLEPYTDTYTVLVTDTAGMTDTAYLRFAVAATNEALYDYTFVSEVDEDGWTCRGYGPITGDPGEPHTATLTLAPEYGTPGMLTETCSGLSYLPENRTESYTATFAYAVTDTLPSSAVVSMVVTVTADNDPPYIDQWLWYPWSTKPGHPITASLTVSDTDVDQPQPTADLASGPEWFKLTSFENGTATFGGTPSVEDVGIVTFSVRGYDGLVYGEPMTVSFEVVAHHDTSYVDGTEGTDNMWYGGAPRGLSFESIGYALDHTNPGGTIYVAPGIYTETITVTKPITLSRYFEGGTGDRAIINATGSPDGIGVLISESQVSLTGFDIVNAEQAVRALPGVHDISINWCNLVSDTWGVSAMGVENQVDGRSNYWGSADGPAGEGSGGGSGVTANVDYVPWLGAGVLGLDQQTLTGTATLDAEVSSGLSATLTTTLPVTLTLAQYKGNPQAPFLYEDDLFWDVQLLDATGVDQMVVRFYIDEAHQEGKQRWNTRIMWWDESSGAWVPCSHQAWYRPPNYYWADWEGIDVTFGPDTVPSLSQLAGTEFGVQAVPQLFPLGLSMQRTGGPTRFAPGWNLRFEMVISNTAPIPLHNVVISDIVPVAMYNVMESTGGFGEPTIEEAVYCCEYHVYDIGELAPGETLTQTWTYHTPSSMADGQGFLYEAIGTSFEGDWEFVGMGLHCDHSLREPTPAPTPEGARVLLPVMLKP